MRHRSKYAELSLFDETSVEEHSAIVCVLLHGICP